MEMELFLITQLVGKAKNKKQNKTQVSKKKTKTKKPNNLLVLTIIQYQHGLVTMI